VARHVNVELVDDIDGSPAAETVDFGLDGVRYTIDLSKDNAAQLRSTLRPYVRKAREMRTSTNAGAKHRRRAAANTTALIRDLAERAKDQHRGGDARNRPDDHAAGEAATGPGTAGAGTAAVERPAPATSEPAASEPTTAPVTEPSTEPAAKPVVEPSAEPAGDSAPEAPAPLPLAPVFQPPQR
jgi:Mg-chelatase subunit ChlI